MPPQEADIYGRITIHAVPVERSALLLFYEQVEGGGDLPAGATPAPSGERDVDKPGSFADFHAAMEHVSSQDVLANTRSDIIKMNEHVVREAHRVDSQLFEHVALLTEEAQYESSLLDACPSCVVLCVQSYLSASLPTGTACLHLPSPPQGRQHP